MLTRDVPAFLAHARNLPPDFGPPVARAAFLVAPDGFALAQESASDNHYMAGGERFDASRAHTQHRALHCALSSELPVWCFSGDPSTPDALFPNNVFATTPGQLIVGRMRHPVRQREASRMDIRSCFTDILGYRERDLSGQPHPCELTGAIVIDRARGIGFCGLSERCDAQGAASLHAAFGLRATLVFDLAPGEYHTNVVLMVLAGRMALLSPGGFADAAVPQAIAALYAPHVARVSTAEQHAFVCNALSLTQTSVWMSATAAAAAAPETLAALRTAGLDLRSVQLDAIEAAGGSMRCCIAEIF